MDNRTRLEADTLASVSRFLRFLESERLPLPSLHCVLGTGIGSSLQDEWLGGDWELAASLSFSELPTLSGATAPGHAGVYRFLRHRPSGKVLLLQNGRLHGYEGLPAASAVRPVLISAYAGTPSFVLSNAAGGLHPEWPVGTVMMIRDHVNLTGQNPLTGPVERDASGRERGERFPDMTSAWDREMNLALASSFLAAGLRVEEGVYLGVGGPSFETPAEVNLFARWGMDAVGMSTVWESIALSFAGKRVAGFSLISNPGCGLVPGMVIDHHAILEECRSAARLIICGILSFAAHDFLNS